MKTEMQIWENKVSTLEGELRTMALKNNALKKNEIQFMQQIKDLRQLEKTHQNSERNLKQVREITSLIFELSYESDSFKSY